MKDILFHPGRKTFSYLQKRMQLTCVKRLNNFLINRLFRYLYKNIHENS
ncbi:protein of unknown function [Bartonella clarridgeiae 73]|uniref:Uncharacterized protein n=1 Tax=Bartonella clarridgeiae (strain CCUG 45776 / CIP 104772 / 73) TaxID=696125 RepID=E6YIF1_BARC7|nr:protein of unknown function [Bartonella clarridgeiae 73]